MLHDQFELMYVCIGDLFSDAVVTRGSKLDRDSILDMFPSAQRQEKGHLVNCALVFDASAWKWCISHVLMLRQPKQVTQPCQLATGVKKHKPSVSLEGDKNRHVSAQLQWLPKTRRWPRTSQTTRQSLVTREQKVQTFSLSLKIYFQVPRWRQLK